MSKVRIIQKDGFFYPQHRLFFIWCNYQEHYLEEAGPQYCCSHLDSFRPYKFRTKQQARYFIKQVEKEPDYE